MLLDFERPTEFTGAVMDRLKKNGNTAHLEVREVADSLIFSNREICINIEDYKKSSTIYESVYCNGTKRGYVIYWDGENELNLNEYYCCYKSGSFIGIWDYHDEEEEKA